MRHREKALNSYEIKKKICQDTEDSFVRYAGGSFYGLFLGKLTADPCMDSGSEIRMAQTADPLFGSAADKYTLPDVLV